MMLNKRVLLCGLLFGFVQHTNAAILFSDDFEDLNHNGWNISGTSGTSGVEFDNESNWAYISTSNSPMYSLTREFTYDPNHMLSFDYHPVYAAQGQNGSSASGYSVSFENSLNIELGSVTFLHSTTGYSLPDNSYVVDNSVDHSEAFMSDWANLALVDPSADISSIVLDFWVDGTSSSSGGWVSGSSARMRFDNVVVSTVPVPPAIWLFGSSLLGLIGVLKRKKLV